MEIIFKGEPKEIAAFVLAVQRRQPEEVAEDVGAVFAEKLHRAIKDQQEAIQYSRESR